MEIKTRVSAMGYRIIEATAMAETNGNISLLLRRCLAQHPAVQAARAAHQLDEASRMAQAMLSQPVTLTITKIDKQLLAYLERGDATLAELYQHCAIDQRRDADLLQVTPTMLEGLLLQLVRLVRLNCIDVSGDPTTSLWHLTTEGRQLARRIAL